MAVEFDTVFAHTSSIGRNSPQRVIGKRQIQQTIVVEVEPGALNAQNSIGFSES